MANYVTNRLSVTGNSRALDELSAAVGSASVPFDFCKISEIIPCTWDERDGADGTFQRTGNELATN